jgi:hypothetical protein
VKRRTPLRARTPLRRRTPLLDRSEKRDLLTRCCGKKAYATEEAARADLERIQMLGRTEKVPQRVYACKNGWHHITSQKGSSSANVPRATRELVYERDELSCFCCGVSLLGQPFSLQHRDARGMGGSSDPLIHSPANLILLRGTGITECHGRVEQRGEADNVAGYWLRHGQDPAETPVLHWRLGPVLLTHEGAVVPVGRAA